MALAEAETKVEAWLTGRMDRLERELASAKVWALLLYITLAGAVYGTLARTNGLDLNAAAGRARHRTVRSRRALPSPRIYARMPGSARTREGRSQC
jgi:hypothetical protein